VYVYARSGSSWVQQAYLKSADPLTQGGSHLFGHSIALSSDGSVLAVGAPDFEGSTTRLGSVYTFSRTNNVWQYVATLHTGNGFGDNFGYAVALSGDGKSLLIGAPFLDIAVTHGGSLVDSGLVYLYTWTGTDWGTPSTFPKTSTDFQAGAQFGTTLAFSEDGSTFAVGVPHAQYTDATINGFYTDVGMVYVVRMGANGNTITSWYPLTQTIEANMLFGYSVALSSDGTEIAIGAPGKNNSTGVVSTLHFVGKSSWAYDGISITAANGKANDRFGTAVALSGDGKELLVGAPFEGGIATGINGDPTNASAHSGAAYLFKYSTSWSQTSYLKAPIPGNDDYFGDSVSLSGDGSTIAVGAPNEYGGQPANQNDNSAPYAGAAYLY
jgi:hypothetical protein